MKRLENGSTGYTRHTSKERYHCAPFLRPDGSSMIRPSASWQGRRSSAVDESVFSRTRESAILGASKRSTLFNFFHRFNWYRSCPRRILSTLRTRLFFSPVDVSIYPELASHALSLSLVWPPRVEISPFRPTNSQTRKRGAQFSLVNPIRLEGRVRRLRARFFFFGETLEK